MVIDILTLFPDTIKPYLNESIIKSAIEKGIIEVNYINIRNYSKDKHKNVDDTPYGGGPGMLLTPQPLYDAILDCKKKNIDNTQVIFFTPQGKQLSQTNIKEYIPKDTKNTHYILICGRYEGIDQRVRDLEVNSEISIGPYVLTGGELPAMVFIDSLIRLIPNVLGNNESHEMDSFSESFNGMCEYPQYTKPAIFQGIEVPATLRNGNHKEIEKWKKNNLGKPL